MQSLVLQWFRSQGRSGMSRVVYKLRQCLISSASQRNAPPNIFFWQSRVLDTWESCEQAS